MTFVQLFDDINVVIFLRLAIAAALGALIGWEREMHGQAAGLRTNTIVALGACLMMLLSLYMEELFHSAPDTVRLDPARIASYAIASMGFLGAGAIIKGKGTVRGLTTAAGLWLVTGLGLAVGAGYVIPAIITTALSMGVLFSAQLVHKCIEQDIFTSLVVTLSCGQASLKTIRDQLERTPTMHMLTVNYYHDIPAGTVTYRMRVRCKSHIRRGQVVRDLLALPGILRIAWEEGEVP